MTMKIYTLTNEQLRVFYALNPLFYTVYTNVDEDNNTVNQVVPYRSKERDWIKEILADTAVDFNGGLDETGP